MRFMAGWLVSMSLFASLVWGDEGHHHALTEQEIGSVHFATSCAKTAETSFNHAVALLHSFQYEDSRQAFEAIARQDPTCAMGRRHVLLPRFVAQRRYGGRAGGLAQSTRHRTGPGGSRPVLCRSWQFGSLSLLYAREACLRLRETAF
jgi:hypothetical protein